jgi:L-lysine 2,3-aminomutase
MPPKALPIPISITATERESWQRSLARAIRDPFELARRLELPESWAAQAQQASRQFPLFVTNEFVARMETGNPNDPLLRQVLPLADEMQIVPGFVSDPVGDLDAQSVPGVLHKYQGRALLITTGACAVHCRYCFRRHFPYSEQPNSQDEWNPALEYLRQDTTIAEVILSGGDPLTVVDRKLAWLVEQLDDIPHLRRLRIHTRLPIFLPQRVCDEMLDWFGSTRMAKWVVLHSNHARELDDQVANSLEKLRRSGATLLNQSVLLSGVNDNVQALRDLSERLIDLNVVPYYLHQLDPVQGAAHFQVSVERGREMIRQLESQLPGYAVPRYVAEYAGRSSKTGLLDYSSTREIEEL